ncbi:MAG: metal-dependent hydrolase [Deltaproteobacteria bacterium]|nr:MAG: metal-dependent hydrolase [Deltaproteobacteria bacterium]
MPTFVSHAVVGLAAGVAVAEKKMPARFWVLSAVCPALPDLDVGAFALGIPYSDPLGHRGFSHSLCCAFVTGLLVTLVFFRKHKPPSGRFWLLSVYFFLITASHGLLDAMTNGGLGVALLAPFDNYRIFFPFRPLQVSPIGIRHFFSPWGLSVAASEFLWVWIPSILLAAAVRLGRSIFGSQKSILITSK